MKSLPSQWPVAVIGGGPAGLMAAEVLSAQGVRVELFDAMPSVGRKFLLAGKGGMNITHSEPHEAFLARFGDRRALLEPMLNAFGADNVRAWAKGLGIETFVGSSGRVFPMDMKAAPLLRAWLHRLREAGVRFHMRHRWCGWAEDGALVFSTVGGTIRVRADAVVLALGGASWARLGSDGAWVPLLSSRGVDVARLRPANCGFDVTWSDQFRARFAGQPVKSVVATLKDVRGVIWQRQGEFVISASGVEGSLIYALSAPIRDVIEETGGATLSLDLVPGKALRALTESLARPRGKESMSNHLRKRGGLDAVKAALLRECAAEAFNAPTQLAAAIKDLPLHLRAPRPLDEAISTAGGVAFAALDEHLMLRSLPGVFCAGEMLDWEAPTGGYLLTGCFATGRAAARGALAWLKR